MFDIEYELKNLPDSPGVYIMRDKDDKVIYVGKAKVLKNRVRQYFHSNRNHSPKVIAMVSNISRFEYIVTDSEIEALVLECNLIKKYRPKYNILLKDDKQYPYIKVSINEDYPKIFMTRTLKNDGAKYFGPYTGMQTVKNTIDIVQKIFKPPTCQRRFPEDIGKGRPCLNHHINNCFAPCIQGKVTKEEYRQIFFDICSFLEGNHKELLSEMKKNMELASKEMEFEKAAALRDKISAILQFEQKQKIVNSDHQTDIDIIAVEKLEDKAFVEVFFVRMGKITGHKGFKLDNLHEETENDIITEFLEQFYMDTEDIPKEIIVEYEPLETEVLAKWLGRKKGASVKILNPKRGEKKKLLQMVHKNAEISAENYRLNQIKYAQNKNRVSKELAKKMGLQDVPERIESYDISNISGSNNVASMVVFVDAKPSKKDYRYFKIKSVDGANDYLAMQEVIYRRFRRAIDEQEAVLEGTLDADKTTFLPLPDLILLDGGKGHLSSVLEIMDTLDMDVPVYGMVKDKKHRTRGLVSKQGEIDISPTDPIFKFLTNVQDEVHRSAISYHRKLRSKELEKSELDSIDGIGKVKKTKLLSHFKALENIKNATLEEIEKVLDKKSAKAVFDYFHLKD